MEYESDISCAVERLITEIEQHESLIIAVDFDNTLYDYHGVGADYSYTINMVKRAIAFGHKVFIFTGNSDHDLVKEVCWHLGLRDLDINSNEMDPIFKSRKPFYSILLDDRAGLSSALETLNQVLDYQATLAG